MEKLLTFIFASIIFCGVFCVLSLTSSDSVLVFSILLVENMLYLFAILTTSGELAYVITYGLLAILFYVCYVAGKSVYFFIDLLRDKIDR